MILSVIAFIVSLVYVIVFPILEARLDYEKIKADGSKDSLKETFHRNNFIKRGLMLLALSIVANIHLNVSEWHRILLIGSFLLFSGTWFGVCFNTQLSLLRGLNPWYVSKDYRAAKTDKLLIKYAKVFNMEPEQFHKRLYGGALVISVVIFLLAYILILFL